jgi:hypothetical protein
VPTTPARVHDRSLAGSGTVNLTDIPTLRPRRW